MVDKYQKHKERLQKKNVKDIKILLKKKKGKTRSKIGIKIFLRNNKKKSISIIMNVIRIFPRNKS